MGTSDSIEKDYGECEMTGCDYYGLVVNFRAEKGGNGVCINLCPSCATKIFTILRRAVVEDIRGLKTRQGEMDKIVKREKEARDR